MTKKNPPSELAAHMEAWIVGQLARHGIAEGTAHQYRTTIRSFCDCMGPDKHVQDVTVCDIERWLAQPKRDGTRYKPQSMNARAAPIRAFFSYASHPSRGLIRHNPTLDLPRAKVPERQPKSILPEDVSRMLWIADGRERTILIAGLQLGLRREEIARMNVEHWDRSSGLIRVIGKGNKEATIPVGGETAETFNMWRDVGLGGRRAGPFWPSDRSTSTANRLSVSAVGRIVTSVAARAGVDATCHNLRHTCATDMVQSGVPMNVVQGWMRHASQATTGDYMTPRARDLQAYADYRRYLPEEQRDPTSAARLGSPTASAETLTLFRHPEGESKRVSTW